MHNYKVLVSDRFRTTLALDRNLYELFLSATGKIKGFCGLVDWEDTCLYDPQYSVMIIHEDLSTAEIIAKVVED